LTARVKPESKAPLAAGPPPKTAAEKPEPRRSIVPYVTTFVVCIATWLVLSGKFDVFHITLGVISSVIVAYASGDMLITTVKVGRLPGIWLRFILYIPWLLWEIFRANLHVTRLVFHPRMMDLIDPQIIKFKTRLDGEMARFVFANSITLTPGTITVYVSLYGNFSVHAIDEASALGLPGEMETRVAAIFGE
jgi:multicomponent Na+:H+ antiporter subunit E